MKKLYFLLALIWIVGPTTRIFGQGEQVKLDPIQVVANAIPVMLHAEAKLAEKQSITFGGGLAFSAFYENINGQETLSFFLLLF